MRHAACGHRVGRLAVACALLVSALPWTQPAAVAQYTSDPASEEEQGEHVRYFGSVKDEDGAVVPDATLIIRYKTSSFVFVTDRMGRFRGHLPPDALPTKVAVNCFKADFALVRVTKRAGPSGPSRTVQVDCRLRAAPGTVPAA